MAEFKIITHRCRMYGPENSLAAFGEALDSAVDAIEIDVQLTKDKQFLLNHDAWYRDGRGKKHTIKRQLLVDAERCGRFSLDTALTLFKRYGAGKELQIDVKTHGQEAQLVELIRQHKLGSHVLIVSWSGKTLETVHKLDPKLKLSFSFAPGIWPSHTTGKPLSFSLRLPAFLRAKKIPLAAVNICPLLDTPPSEKVIKAVQGLGYKVVVVNDDTPEENDRLVNLGVVGTMTNDAPTLLVHYGRAIDYYPGCEAARVEKKRKNDPKKKGQKKRVSKS